MSRTCWSFWPWISAWYLGFSWVGLPIDKASWVQWAIRWWRFSWFAWCRASLRGCGGTVLACEQREGWNWSLIPKNMRHSPEWRRANFWKFAKRCGESILMILNDFRCIVRWSDAAAHRVGNFFCHLSTKWEDRSELRVIWLVINGYQILFQLILILRLLPTGPQPRAPNGSVPQRASTVRIYVR